MMQAIAIKEYRVVRMEQHEQGLYQDFPATSEKAVEMG